MQAAVRQADLLINLIREFQVPRWCAGILIVAEHAAMLKLVESKLWQSHLQVRFTHHPQLCGRTISPSERCHATTT